MSHEWRVRSQDQGICCIVCQVEAVASLSICVIDEQNFAIQGAQFAAHERCRTISQAVRIWAVVILEDELFTDLPALACEIPRVQRVANPPTVQFDENLTVRESPVQPGRRQGAEFLALCTFSRLGERSCRPWRGSKDPALF